MFHDDFLSLGLWTARTALGIHGFGCYVDKKLARHIPTAVVLLTSGTDEADMPELLGVTQRQWNQIRESADFKVAFEQAVSADQQQMTAEEVIARATSMTPDAFETLDRVMNDSRATPTARLKAAEIAFGWRQELQKRRAEADARIVYTLVVDERAVHRMEAMLDMLAGEEGRKWLQEVSQIMPNSTA